MIKNRYKLARIVNGLLLSANSYLKSPDGISCLEYKIGEITKTNKDSETYRGIACYKTKEAALLLEHIDETRGSFNRGNLIVLLKLRPIGKPVWTNCTYRKYGCYEGGINYRSVKVLEATVVA